MPASVIDVPVVEVILPAVRRAVATTRNGRIGVIGTQATVASGAYQDAFAAARDTEVTAVACPRFVDFVERGITSGRQVLGLAEGYLEPLQRADVDTLVLGCTHYPLLSGLIQLAMGDEVTLVSSAEETAKDLLRVLTERDLLHPHPTSRRLRARSAFSRPPAIRRRSPHSRRGFWGRRLRRRPVHRHIGAQADLLTESGDVFHNMTRAWHSSDRANYRARLLRERRRPGFAGIGLPAEGPDTPPLVIDFGGGVLGALQRHADPDRYRCCSRICMPITASMCRACSCGVVTTRRRPRKGACCTARATPGRGLAPRRHPTAAKIDDCSDIFDVRHWVDGEAVNIGAVNVAPRLVCHPTESYGMRITDPTGATFVYSGDTGFCDAVIDLARGADVFLCEASWTHRPTRPPNLHLSGTEAGRIAAAAGVGELLLTHIPPWTSREDVISEAKAEFDGPVHAVVCGETFVGRSSIDRAAARLRLAACQNEKTAASTTSFARSSSPADSPPTRQVRW